jgi:uncharacterized Zn-finger protein
MKIALCLSGQPRDIDIIYPIMNDALLYREVDVFVHSWFDPDNLSQNSVIPDRTHKTISSDAIEKINNFYKPKKILVEKPKFWNRKYSFTEKVFDEGPGWARNVEGGIEVAKKYLCNMTNSMFYSIMMSNLLKEQYSIENNIEYDIVIRCRTDFSPHAKINFDAIDLNDNEILCHSTGLPYGMPHDWFSIGTTSSMNAYCGVYNHIQELVNQSIMIDGWWCNELLLKHHLNNNNIKIKHANLLVFGHKG